LDGLLDEAPTSQTIKPVRRRGTTADDEDEPTRLDMGLPIATPPPEPVTPPPAEAPRERLDTIDRPLDEEPLDSPTTRRSGREEVPPPARGHNPRPAVSAIAPPKASRRTPQSGVAFIEDRPPPASERPAP